MKRFPPFPIILILFFILSMVRPVWVMASDDRILVIQSRKLNPYNEALEGWKQFFEQESFPVQYNEYNLEEYANKESELISRIDEEPPRLIFAVGTEAALFSKNNFKDIPIVFAMVLDPVESGIVSSGRGSRENITGVSLKISIEAQFKKLKEVIPKIKVIGMLYDVKNMSRSKEEAQEAADRLKLTLAAKPIYSKTDVDKALAEIVKEADCLWAGVDTFIYNPQSAQHILLWTLRNKIPFMAFSSNYVNAGALLALECDYVDIGRQAAQMAIKILKGEELKSLGIETPRRTRVIINQKTAQLIGVDVPRMSLE